MWEVSEVCQSNIFIYSTTQYQTINLNYVLERIDKFWAKLLMSYIVWWSDSYIAKTTCVYSLFKFYLSTVTQIIYNYLHFNIQARLPWNLYILNITLSKGWYYVCDRLAPFDLKGSRFSES